MPVHIRKFLLRETQKIKDKEAKQIKDAKGSKPIGGGGKVSRPGISPKGAR